MTLNITHKLLTNNIEQLHNFSIITAKLKNELLEIINKGISINKFPKFTRLCLQLKTTCYNKNKMEDYTNIINLLNELYENKYCFKQYNCLISQDELLNLTISQCQQQATKEIMQFLLSDNNFFGLYGYAGTGKTTLLTKLLAMLIKNRYIYSFTLTAPTNKAVDILKLNFLKCIDEICEHYLGEESIDWHYTKQLHELKDKKAIKIEFVTIQKLLGYKMTHDTNGNVVFEKNNLDKKVSYHINNYNIIIIDECSMLNVQIVIDIFRLVNKNPTETKIIFLGDPAQLPPVNEKTSYIFNTLVKEFNDNIIKQYFERTENEADLNVIKLKSDIINFPKFTMTSVVRTNNSKLIQLLSECRKWIVNEIKCPKFSAFKDENIVLYKHDKNIKKTESQWFKNYIKYINNDQANYNNVILTWTNNESLNYNNKIRNMTYGDDVNLYEVGDIIIMNDYYNSDDGKLYTCEQLRVIQVSEIEMLLNKISKKIVSNEYMTILGSFYDSLIRNINDNIIDLIPTFKLQVVKLSNGEEQIDKTYTIYTLDHDTKQLINSKMLNIKSDMKHFENVIKKKFTNEKAITYLEKNILIPLWSDINNIYINKFAQISISYSTTTNKSQSSTYCNVFVDIDNMLSNKNILDAKKCIYTAISRASHKVHLLI